MPADAWPAARPDLASQVVDLVNAYRTQLGLPALAVSPTLTAAATWKARHMAAYDYMEHDDPGPPAPRTAADRMAACGYPQVGWGENIAMGYGTAEDVFSAWLASPPHRENIEDPTYRATGVGAAGNYWSQTFGTTVDGSTSRAAATTPPVPDAAPQAATVQDSSVAPATIHVHCRRPGRSVKCRVRGGKGATVRITVIRGGAIYASVRARVASDDQRVRLRSLRRLRAGRYSLLVRATLPSGTQERRVGFAMR